MRTIHERFKSNSETYMINQSNLLNKIISRFYVVFDAVSRLISFVMLRYRISPSK